MLITNISKLSDAGVLAERSARSPALDFKRFNLIYGFNGSGKSTLSRCFAALQAEPPPVRLPAGCEFEFVTNEGATVRADAGNILSGRVLQFLTRTSLT